MSCDKKQLVLSDDSGKVCVFNEEKSSGIMKQVSSSPLNSPDSDFESIDYQKSKNSI